MTILKNQIKQNEEFISQIRNKIEDSNEKDILIFIHGFNVEFNEAIYRTAQLGYDLCFRRAVNAFAWPSQGTFSGYLADMDTAKNSALFLKEFIKKLITQTQAQKLHIIAHSMGNVVLTEALTLLKGEGVFPSDIFNQIIF